ncbi:AraC family transcriptional regulator [Dactylosporangium vinaceum]|uniref:Helix-turn-helix domain-containing protein n=1 Tax=Dactylosporangium vinaceum TaxID=53362 RepID=A0ABV5MMA8_9ACTN|nr:helix-turn-helix domain-containing protein [Dactylosporangium vinaceum]UAB93286.1 AraC family transcriptional regulator [Dactylosporangium vinaceum]
MDSEHVLWRPAPAVRRYAAWYTGYAQHELPPGRHRGLPSPYLTLIVTIGRPLRVVAHPDPSAPPAQYATIVGGLHVVPALIEQDGTEAGIQVALSPLGARALLGLPAGELAGADLDGTDVLGPLAAELHERVALAEGWAARFRIVDELLTRRAAPDRAPAPEVSFAWQRLCATGGALSAAELAGETGWSGRYLARRFGVEIGLTPKVAGRVARFDRARRLLQSAAGGRPLAELAVACGYYDQAHLTREFTALAGLPPARWWAEEFRNVQSPQALAGADSAA